MIKKTIHFKIFSTSVSSVHHFFFYDIYCYKSIFCNKSVIISYNKSGSKGSIKMNSLKMNPDRQCIK